MTTLAACGKCKMLGVLAPCDGCFYGATRYAYVQGIDHERDARLRANGFTPVVRAVDEEES